MITIRQMILDDQTPICQEDAFKEWLKGDYHEDQSYVLIDNQQILGIASFELIDAHQALLAYIYIKADCRGQHMGDGLFRAILNHIDKEGIDWVYCPANQMLKPFYQKEDLERLDLETLSETIKDKCFGPFITEVYGVRLPDFFNQPCKSQRGLV